MNTACLAGIRLGVSACLLGHAVRFDGGDKRNRRVLDLAAHGVIFEPVCPEAGSGLPSPRAAMRLVSTGAAVRVVDSRHPHIDHTRRLAAFSDCKVAQLTALDGFILKKDSPSCGMERVKLYAPSGVAQRTATGVFAAKLMRRFPLLPVEEEGRLNDVALYENFIERVLAYHDWQVMTGAGITPGALVSFHTRHKLQLLARDEKAYRALGRLTAEAGRPDFGDRYNEYIATFMVAMKKQPTPRRHSNVLFHMAGYFKRHLSADDRQEMVELIEAYRRERLPLIAPLMLLRHHLRAIPNRFLENQRYLTLRIGDLSRRSDGATTV